MHPKTTPAGAAGAAGVCRHCPLAASSAGPCLSTLQPRCAAALLALPGRTADTPAGMATLAPPAKAAVIV
eukprot:scaffold152997_cov21-Tisochrysis_lutea.AAC.2